MSARPSYAASATTADLAAFNRLVTEHQTLLYTVAYRLLGSAGAAASATQAAVRRAYERPGPVDLPPRTWLLRCLLTLCPAEAAPADGASGLARGLLALPAEQRQVLALVDVAGLDYAQAAAALELTPGQLRARLARARRALLSRAGAP